MKILITGNEGFIGKNLSFWLKSRGYEVFGFDINDNMDTLRNYIKECDFIIHLAGINRPLSEEEFYDGNVNFTKKLLDIMEKEDCHSPILFSSSVKASEDNAYGKSKLMAENLIREFGDRHGNKTIIYRLHNAFGKWCRPNYNSVIATFCHNVAHDLPLSINENAPAIEFVYIDDICDSFEKEISKNSAEPASIKYISPRYLKKLDEIASLLNSYKISRLNGFVPEINDQFSKKLYSTYLSYLDDGNFSYCPNTHRDHRGSFTEILKTSVNGQISVNVSKPGITKGNHYHNTKTEKFLVVKGVCEIKFRKIDCDKIITYICDDSHLSVIDIPPGYTHSIKNIGKDDSVTLMWANELYDPKNSDTYYLPVEKE